MIKEHNRFRTGVLCGGDILVLLSAAILAFLTRFGLEWHERQYYAVPLLILVGVYFFCFYVFNLYEQHLRYKSVYFLSRFVVAVIAGFAIMAFVSYMVPFLEVGRGLALLSSIYLLVLLPVWRFIFEEVFLFNLLRKRVLIVGAGYAGRYIADVVKKDRNFEPVGFIDDAADKHNMVIGGVKVIGGSELLPAMARDKAVDIVVVAITNERSNELFNRLFSVKMAGITIMDLPALYEAVTGKIPVSHLRIGWLVFSSFNAISRHRFAELKRYFDLSLALVLLIVTTPLMLLLMILIKLDSRGPVFYRQKRVGKNGKEFVMYKFRSMVVDAEKKEGGLYTLTRDARVTRLGGILRKIRFDELPQLWNIFIGDMSLVGPRPEAVELSEKYQKIIPHYIMRHVVRPGLSGWAQVRYSYSASTEDALEKFKYDMYYLKNMSFTLDVQVILKTISVIVFRDGSR